MATIDSNGVLIYQDTDNYTPIQTALNLAQSNLSSLLGASTQIVRVSSVGDRDAKATARGSISKANPFVAWRADAADGLQLEYTTNGTTWRTIADKEYYDSRDTGWVNVTPAAGFTSVGAQVRLRNGVIAFRGSFSGGALSTAGTVVGTVPAGYRPPGGADDSVSAIGLGNGTTARATINSAGAISVIPPSNATTTVYLKGLSGYLVD